MVALTISYLLQSFREFNTHYAQRRASSSSQPPLVVNRVKVTFANEPGEGSGVARGFYTALAEAILTPQVLIFKLILFPPTCIVCPITKEPFDECVA